MDLYQKSIAGAEFARFCGGNNQEENNESCVTFAPIPELDAFAVRDSKAPGAGELRFTGAELDAFALGYIRQRGLG